MFYVNDWIAISDAYWAFRSTASERREDAGTSQKDRRSNETSG